MALRDRTAEFLQFRSARRLSSDAQRLIEEEMHIHKTFIKPLWVEKMEDIRATEKKIEDQMEVLEKLRRNHLKIEFSSTRDEGQEELQIEKVQDVIDSLFKQCELLLNELDSAYMRDIPDCGTDVELGILRNVKMCLINELNNIGKLYREGQRRYMTDVKKQQFVAHRWAGGDRQRVIERQLETDAVVDQYLQKGMTHEQIETILLNQHMVDERVKEFEKIYSSIKSLHEMFKDLNTLVIEQGAVLDRIDYNMTVTHTRVQKGKTELQKAAEYQEAGAFKICVLFLVVLIIGLSFALLIKAIV